MQSYVSMWMLLPTVPLLLSLSVRVLPNIQLSLTCLQLCILWVSAGLCLHKSNATSYGNSTMPTRRIPCRQLSNGLSMIGGSPYFPIVFAFTHPVNRLVWFIVLHLRLLSMSFSVVSSPFKKLQVTVEREQMSYRSTRILYLSILGKTGLGSP